MAVWRITHQLLFVRLGASAALSTTLACSQGEPAIPTSSGWPPNIDSESESGAGSNPDSAPEDALDTGGDAGCPHDLPPSCPSPPPSWANEVQAIVSQRCNACHGAGGIEQSKFDFSTYDGVHRTFGSLLSNVNSCLMPPPDAGALTTVERHALLGWLVCAAPNN